MNLQEVTRANTLAQQVYNSIRKGIREGTIPAGQFFSEVEFGSSLGVSRTPVREALLVLYREGLVEIVNKRGFRLVELTDNNIAEIKLLRITIEKLIVRTLCSIAGKEDIGALRIMLRQQRRSAENMFELDEAFHLRMSELAGLDEAGRMLMGLRGKMYLIASGAQLPAIRNEKVIREHNSIVDAIEQRNPEIAESVVAEHIERSIAAFLEARRLTKPSITLAVLPAASR